MTESMIVHESRFNELLAIEKAARALITCKGRYHSELNTIALAKTLGITLPAPKTVEEQISTFFSSGIMMVCKTCGNKRCPKARDETRECSNSNELGQV